MAELVKTRLLAGRDLDVRGAAAYKAAICLRDPHDHGPRRWLNLGHTFAHALEAAADFDLPHGEAVALGLLAALRLSGRDTAEVERELAPQPVHGRSASAPGRRCSATRSARGDAINLVLLGDGGPGRRAAAGGRGAPRARTADRVGSAAMQVLVLNGVNLDMLGRRDPAVYGGHEPQRARDADLRVGAASST